MNPNVKLILTVFLAAIAIIAFSGIYGYEIFKAFPSHGTSQPIAPAPNPADKAATRGQPEDIKDPYSYVATGLAGLVGGVVALIFGQPAPKSEADLSTLKSILMTVYTLVYFILGFFAIITWVFAYFSPSILLKTLALTFFGFMIPIVSSFLKESSLAVTLHWRHRPPKTEA